MKVISNELLEEIQYKLWDISDVQDNGFDSDRFENLEEQREEFEALNEDLNELIDKFNTLINEGYIVSNKDYEYHKWIFDKLNLSPTK
jgi:hypothetical protein